MPAVGPPQAPVPWHRARVLDFFRFVAERHRMFVLRVGYRQAPPWTSDPILASLRLTNVYRELDRGTRYLIRSILPHAIEAPGDTVWNGLIYRSFNRISTYEALGGFQAARGWDRSGVVAKLEGLQAAGAPVFTGAFRVSQQGYPAGGPRSRSSPTGSRAFTSVCRTS